MTPDEARRQAALAFGGVERFKEEVRDAWKLGWVVMLMVTVGLLAAIGPARRGLRIQSMEALREDG